MRLKHLTSMMMTAAAVAALVMNPTAAVAAERGVHRDAATDAGHSRLWLYSGFGISLCALGALGLGAARSRRRV
ncbi:hypothetical protein [Streptomyces sp. NPDC046939]|uniref:hypothetical protein n=1 Tax=Streptomyces sp. NPDC046939 TaxID=3155376 RepID=UPI0033EA90A4